MLPEIITPKVCRDNPDILFVFGDNLLNRGKRGQAIIRDEPNAWGIPTKRVPSMSSGSFFTGTRDEWQAVDFALDLLDIRAKNYKKVHIPKAGLGTGLAKLNENCPDIFNYIKERVSIYEN